MTLNSWTSSYRLGFLRPVLQYLFLPFFPSFFSFFDSEVQDSVHVIPLHPSWLYNIIILFLPILNVHWMFQLNVTWKKKTLYTYSLSWLINTFISCHHTWNSISKASCTSFPSSLTLHNLFPRETCFLSDSPACQVLFHFRAFTCYCLSESLLVPSKLSIIGLLLQRELLQQPVSVHLLIVPSCGPL